MVTDHETDERCLGHPPVDDPRYPPICDAHCDRIFGWLIRVKAQQLADQMLMEKLATRPRWSGKRRTRERQPATAMLKPGQHLTEQDNAVLAFLTGRTA
jgi:hypothetical protein